MPQNTIKVKQIDNDELLEFLQNSLGLDVAGSTTSHSFVETFNTDVNVEGALTVGGASTFSGQMSLNSGLAVAGSVAIVGSLSAASLSVTDFSLPSGEFLSLNIGSAIITGIPVYSSGQANLGAALSSGTVFGLRQQLNAPKFELDASGQYMPATGVGTSIVMLCVSMGS